MKIIKIIALATVMSIMLSLSAFATYKGYVFVYRYIDSGGDYVDTTDMEEPILQYLWGMGYSAGGYINNSANALYTSLPQADIFVTFNHASAGLICAGTSDQDSKLVGNTYSNMSSANRAISTYSANQLSDVDVAIYLGCNTGNSSNTYGNLVDATLNKGARASVGWRNPITDVDGCEWIKYMFLYYSNENTLYSSMLYADFALQDESGQAEMSNRYVGSSDVYVFHIPE